MRPEFRQLALRAHLRRLAMSRKPIVIGPWRSEVGFEILYWLPLLRWWAKACQVDPKRIVTLTRGGASILYGSPSVDLYRLRSVDCVRLENQYDWQASNVQKQTRITQWDRDVLTEAAAHVLGRGEKFHVLHPSWMYWAFEPFWAEQRGLAYLAEMTDYEPITGLSHAQIDLPTNYVAMKWYDRPTLPVHDERVQQLIAEVTGIVGAQSKIVLLTGSPAADDHADVVVKHPNVIQIPAAAPEKNLEQQFQILAHAQAFIGPYGGMSQVALRLGVPSVNFYTDFGQTAHAHLSLSSILSKKTKVPFLSASVADVGNWRRTISLPMVAKAQESAA